MEWFAWPFAALRSVFSPRTATIAGDALKLEPLTGWPPEKPGRIPFYSHVPTGQIRFYQTYLDRAFDLSPTLEFEENDNRFYRLSREATEEHAVSQLDLELMRLQYVFADQHLREPFRHQWAVTVVNRHTGDFFPSPWTILTAVFTNPR